MTSGTNPPPPRARDLPFATLWRVGFLLATCFMIPVWGAFGIGRATGVGQLTFLGSDVGAVAAIPAGLAIGAAASLFAGALMTGGAVVFVAIRRLGLR